ncbi:MAG: hypothetical protein Q8L48_27105 [Archangium sp.]|nr:hypothetical protein [Archangium sp.]
MATVTARESPFSRVFDRLERAFHSAAHRRILSTGLVAAFLVALVVIELSNRGLLGPGLQRALPRSHFHAVELAFYLLLSFEVASLVFAIVKSVSNAAGKQFEIFSLILLRSSFEAFAEMDEPLRWVQAQGVVWPMLSDAVAALLIFVSLGFYYPLQRHRPLSEDRRDRANFVLAKKVISLVLVVVFSGLALESVWSLATTFHASGFFEAFYTVLIFADVLVVLISLRYNSSYRVVFRNSGLAVATVMLRLALSAPAPWSGALGLFAVLFAVALTLAYNRFAPVLDDAAGTAAP